MCVCVCVWRKWWKIARKKETRKAYYIFVGKPEGEYSRDLGVDGRILIKCILAKHRFYKHGNEQSDSIESGKFLH